MYFCLNRGEIYRKSRLSIGFKCRKDLALIIHDNYQNGPFQTRDIPKGLKIASTSPGVPYIVSSFIYIIRFKEEFVIAFIEIRAWIRHIVSRP